MRGRGLQQDAVKSQAEPTSEDRVSEQSLEWSTHRPTAERPHCDRDGEIIQGGVTAVPHTHSTRQHTDGLCGSVVHLFLLCSLMISTKDSAEVNRVVEQTTYCLRFYIHKVPQ